MDAEGFVELVGPFFEHEADDGVGRYRFLAEPKHRNRNGFVQGGMLMTFADRAMGAFARRNDPERVHATAQLNVQFVRPAKIGADVHIEVRIVRETRKLVFSEAVITAEGEIVATASGIWCIIQRGR
jgi:uncharacterized protein (TIGR00369 family)